MTDLPTLEWFTAEAAAKQLSSTPRWVRMRAEKEQWLSKAEPCPGGQRLLFHRSNVCGREIALNQAGLLKFDGSPPWAQERAQARLDLISIIEERSQRGNKTKARKRYLRMFKDGAFAPHLQDNLKPPSYPTYMRWLKDYKSEGLAGLLPSHAGRAREIPPDVEARLEQLSLERPRAAKVVHDYLRADPDFKGRVPSYSTINRHVQRVRYENA